MNDTYYITIIGQVLGIAAVALGAFSYQMNTPKKLLLVQTATSAVFCIHYLMIGAESALALNAVCILRNIAYYNNDKKIFSSKLCPVIFALIMAGFGVLSWQGIFSLFIIAGLTLNTLCLSLKNPQSIRKSILVTSPLVIIYDIFALSIGGIIYESVAIISSVVGIIRNNRRVSD